MGYHIFHDVEYLEKSFIPSLKLIRDQYTRAPSCKVPVKAIFELREEYQPDLKIDIDVQNLEEQWREVESMIRGFSDLQSADDKQRMASDCWNTLHRMEVFQRKSKRKEELCTPPPIWYSYHNSYSCSS